MARFTTIEAAVPALARWRDAAEVSAQQAKGLRSVGVAVDTASVLPQGEPGPQAEPAVEVAHLLRERAQQGSPVAILPGSVAAAFAAAYRDAGARLWEAPHGPEDWVTFDGERFPAIHPDRHLLMDEQTREAEMFRLAALMGAVAQADNCGPLEWHPDEATGVLWADVACTYTHLDQQYRLQGALAVADGVVLHERGYHQAGSPALPAVSWIVAWQQTGPSERGTRFTGSQVDTLAWLMGARGPR